MGVASPSIILQPAGRRCTEVGAGRWVGEGESGREAGDYPEQLTVKHQKLFFGGLSLLAVCLFWCLLVSPLSSVLGAGSWPWQWVGRVGGFFVFMAAPSLSARLARCSSRDELGFLFFKFYVFFLFPLSLSRRSLAWPICQEDTKAVFLRTKKKKK